MIVERSSGVDYYLGETQTADAAAGYRRGRSRRRSHTARPHRGMHVRSRDPAAGLGGAPGRAVGRRATQLLAERWETDADHHGYLDLYGNRCERFTIPAGDVADRLRGRRRARRAARRDRPGHAGDADHGAARRAPRRSSCRAASACPTSSATRPGSASATSSPAGSACRRSSTSSTATSSGSPARRTRGRRPSTPTAPARASAATSRTWRSRFCRALNIPARYVFGYIPEIDVPPPVEPMDFAAWFEVYLDGALAHVRRAQQPPPRRPRRRRPRPRRRRRRADDVVRPGHADRVRGPRGVAGVPAPARRARPLPSS